MEDKATYAITKKDPELIQPYELSRFGGRAAHDKNTAIIGGRRRDNLRIGHVWSEHSRSRQKNDSYE
jgi:hypothetical protein